MGGYIVCVISNIHTEKIHADTTKLNVLGKPTFGIHAEEVPISLLFRRLSEIQIPNLQVFKNFVVLIV